MTSQQLCVRNISVIAHVDHGKSSLCDCLLTKAGQLNERNMGQCELDSLAEEKDRGITIVSSAVALRYAVDHALLCEARQLALQRMRAQGLGPLVPLWQQLDGDSINVRLYVGNLPHSTTEQQLTNCLREAMPRLPEQLDICFRKNGSATLTLSGDDALALATQLVASAVRIDDHSVVLEPLRFRADKDATSQLCAAPLPTLSDDADRLELNLIDSPGHLDFSAEVTSALRLTDGGLVVVDCVEGMAPQTNSVLRQALREHVRVVLFLNKVDRAIAQQQLSETELVERLQRVIAQVSTAVASHQAALSFAAGTVAFGSALEGWAISIDSVLALYKKRGADTEKLLRQLSKESTANKTFARAVLTPLYQLRNAASSGDHEKTASILEKCGVPLKGRALANWREAIDNNDTKTLLRMAMRQLYPCADAVIGMVTRHLPSPLEQQRIRAPLLYVPNDPTDDQSSSDDADDETPSTEEEKAVVDAKDDVLGEHDDLVLRGIRACAIDAPTMFFASKSVQLSGRAHALGRLFSGTLQTGQELYVYDDGCAKPRKAKVLSIVRQQTRGVTRVERAVAGDVVGVCGLNLNLGTATSLKSAAPIVSMRALVSDVVGVALRLGKGAKGNAQRTLLDALNELTAADPSLRVVHGDGDDALVLRACGELQLEVCLSRIRSKLAPTKVVASPPQVALKETVIQSSPRNFLGKSSNKHNRVYAFAEPLEEELIQLLSDATTDQTRRAVIKKYFGTTGARRVLCVEGTCLLMDSCVGVSLAPIQDSLAQAFRELVRSGVLAKNQELTGVRISVPDARYHADAKHRAPTYVVPAARRAFVAAVLAAAPRFVEPLVDCHVMVPTSVINDVYSVLHKRSAVCEAADAGDERGFVSISATLTVLNSLGLAQDLRLATKGAAFPSLAPAGWRTLEADVRDVDSTAGKLLIEVRTKAGLS
eukprot:CAMPEP_0168588384 /NCGR_PEP_ID=MMETSP0420-20121227/5424_1 /TAXON_ID=498008 /ORGANISM="Pessonella sp." /LENGTH=939 /DNA_ID=CAMNT_0008623809 /DNA_START=57 /DNA_END=2872 /DNA_ORIENTATION=-